MSEEKDLRSSAEELEMFSSSSEGVFGSVGESGASSSALSYII